MISLAACSHRRPTFPFHGSNPSVFRRSASDLLSLVLPRTGRGESVSPLLARKREGSAPRARRGRKRRPVPGAEEDAGAAGSAALESEIFDFMERSPNPRRFPTKEEFLAAGRTDLVEAIAERGGWLALGWNLDEKEDDKTEQKLKSAEEESGDGFRERDERMFQRRFSGGCHDSALEAGSMAPSSSGRSQEMESAEDSGIEGILNALKKERNLCYSVVSKEIEDSERILTRNEDKLWGISTDAAPGGGRSIKFASASFTSIKDICNDSGGVQHDVTCSNVDGMNSSLKTEMWRTWSAQQAGLPQTEFEAAEIVPCGSGNQWARDYAISTNVDMTDDMYTVTESIHETPNAKNEPSSGDDQSFRDRIRSRLQSLELELTSVLCLLRSRSDSALLHQDQGSSLEEMHKLSDALEFQETEIMKTRDKLRSTRAKLAVLEGKMALEIVEAQKMVEERQKRIDDAKKALCILRTACVVWPTHAKEVFLAGSFDGWTSQRRMEKSSTGMFSLNLKLYPGRYEIKFIVDGLWKIDPLRPITNNNGYENNLLVIS